ncbi:hypothetical protein P2318_07940 [Myxococcaceae bacterium GXIMD 01537]
MNVDLILKSETGISTLLSALGELVLVLSSDDKGACLELPAQPSTPEEAATRFATLILGLSGEAREEWNRCTERTLDVGILPGEVPHEASYRLPASTLSLAASIGADVVFTVYGKQARAG